MERLGFIRYTETQRLPVTGAAAHMSLHLTNNEKEPTPLDPFLCRKRHRFTDVAVNRVSLGEAPLTRAYLGGGLPPVNNDLAILLRGL